MSRLRFVYYTIGDNNPVDEFIDSKSDQAKAKIRFFMDLLAEHGLDLKRPYAAYLRDKIWELRPGINTEEFRLFYFLMGNMAVFVHAVDKKDFKQKDIDVAVKRMKSVMKEGRR